MKEKELKTQSKWIGMRRIFHEDLPPYDYVYLKKSEGQAVTLLPWRFVNNDDAEVEFLVRKDMVPAWGCEKMVITSITGMIEEDEYPWDAASRELKEETGYEVNPNDLNCVGILRLSKITNTKQFTYTVNLNGYEQGEVIGDGTGWEESGSCEWISEQELIHSNCSHLLSAYAKFKAFEYRKIVRV